MSAPLLQVEDLRVRCAQRREAPAVIDGVSISVQRGECVAVLGETYAGKSALAHAILGDDTRLSTWGRIVFDGRDVSGLSAEARRALRGRRMAILPTDAEAALNPMLPIGTQMVEALRAHRTLSPGQEQRRARAALGRAGVEGFEERMRAYPLALPSVERARTAMAFTLLHDPDLVVVDEPARKLDREVQRDFAAHLRADCRERGAAMLWMTRDVEAAERLGDRVAVMHVGRIVEEGPASAVLQRPAHPYTRGLVDATPSRFAPATRLRPPPGKPSGGSLATACAFRDRCGWAMQACLAAPHLQPLGAPAQSRAVRCHRPLPVAAP